ncbi:hypothetical protein N8529_00235 [bacterium]|nr:hypothetical protein [bacterium]
MRHFHNRKIREKGRFATPNLSVRRLSLAGVQIGCQCYLMNSITNLIRFWILMAVLGSSASGADDPPLFYPFKVTIGDQEAHMKDPGDLFATIEKPVKAENLLKIDREADFLIANACPCKEDGTILDGNHVIAIYAPKAKSLPLISTLKKEPLKPGTYLMNVVAHGKTSRVVFTIADPKGEIQFPKVSDIIKFLKGDS